MGANQPKLSGFKYPLNAGELGQRPAAGVDA